MELLSIDYLTLEESLGGNSNILVATDHFTRFAVAIPTRNQTGKTTGRVLFDPYFWSLRISSKNAQSPRKKLRVGINSTAL